MTPRAWIALLAITALVLVPGVLVGVAIPGDGSPVGPSLFGAHEQAALVALPGKAPRPTVLRFLPYATVILAAVTAVRFGARRRSRRGLPFLLGDVGDRWRALLFGAPPPLL